MNQDPSRGRDPEATPPTPDAPGAPDRSSDGGGDRSREAGPDAESGAPPHRGDAASAADGTAREERPVGAFEEVELRFYGELWFSQGDDYALTVEGDPELVSRTHTRVEGSTLVLGFGRDWLERLRSGLQLLGNRPLRYRVRAPRLRGVAVSGRGRVRLDPLRAARLSLRVSGSGEVEANDLQVDELELEVSGRGEFLLGGRAELQRIVVSGSGAVRSEALRTRRTEVRISGHGDVRVAVDDELDVAVSGWGRVGYRGSPGVLRERVSGGGGVRRLEE